MTPVARGDGKRIEGAASVDLSQVTSLSRLFLPPAFVALGSQGQSPIKSSINAIVLLVRESAYDFFQAYWEDMEWQSVRLHARFARRRRNNHN